MEAKNYWQDEYETWILSNFIRIEEESITESFAFFRKSSLGTWTRPWGRQEDSSYSWRLMFQSLEFIDMLPYRAMSSKAEKELRLLINGVWNWEIILDCGCGPNMRCGSLMGGDRRAHTQLWIKPRGCSMLGSFGLRGGERDSSWVPMMFLAQTLLQVTFHSLGI